jgi:hypothetical protein
MYEEHWNTLLTPVNLQLGNPAQRPWRAVGLPQPLGSETPPRSASRLKSPTSPRLAPHGENHRPQSNWSNRNACIQIGEQSCDFQPDEIWTNEITNVLPTGQLPIGCMMQVEKKLKPLGQVQAQSECDRLFWLFAAAAARNVFIIHSTNYLRSSAGGVSRKWLNWQHSLVIFEGDWKIESRAVAPEISSGHWQINAAGLSSFWQLRAIISSLFVYVW